MSVSTIAADVLLASAKRKKLNHHCQDGRSRVTRKNPHVIGAGLKRDITLNYWFCMSTVISTIVNLGIYEQSVLTV